MSFTVAIIGRPNVGKSTLFNRLVRQRLALVDDMPGVTRDRREGTALLGDLEFRVIDTAGLEDVTDNSLAGRMRSQTERAIADADVSLMVIDARTGVTPIDHHFAELLRRGAKPVILVANKSEGRVGLAGAYEAFELGLGDPVALSAEHGEGLGDLFDALLPFVPAMPEPVPVDEVAAALDAETEADDKPLQLAIVGRPNVGKSTLANSLLGEDRLLTGPEAGITRDSIAIDWDWRSRPVRLIDTAGLRRKNRIEEKLEKLSVSDTLRAIRFAEVVVLVLDATLMLEKQDLTIARLVEDEGRALVLALSKWDLIEDKPAALQQLKDRLQISLPQLLGITFVPVSGVTGAGLDKLMEAVFATHAVWNRRVGTPKLNRWLAEIQERHPPPIVNGRRLRLRYMTQANIRPPTFALFSSKPGDLPDAYRRYLVNLLRSDFDLPGVPIRVMLRKGDNPYADKKG
ncbi:MAG TPA: ribosome biogenesis GTPase Der [Stellaceae bacterium]|nr:ribosome biogenesis GTPase Der [Stellaceae bacterium]